MRSLKLLGGATLVGRDGPVTGRGAHRRRLALLARLAVERGRPVLRDRLTGCLWAEHPQSDARHLLSESLYQLRKELDAGALVARGDGVALDPCVLPSDVHDFECAVERGELAAAVAMYRGPLLDGFYVADAPAFEQWADGERDRLARMYGGALERLAEAAEAAGDVLAAAEWWRRATLHDPFSPRLALRLVRALDAAGERPAALRHAAAHAERMRTELGVEPGRELTDFAERLRAAPPPPAPKRAASAGPAVPPPPVPQSPATPNPSTPLNPSTPRNSSTSPDPSIEPSPLTPSTSPAPAPWTVAPAPPAARAPHPDPAEDDRPVDVPAFDRGGVYRGPERRRGGGGRLRSRPAMLLSAAGALLVVMALTRPSRAPANVDASTYVVLPFVVRTPGGVGALTPDVGALVLHDALGRWTDLRLVDRERTRREVAREGGAATLDDALRVAERLGAGTLVWGEAARVGDSVLVRGQVYDVARGTTVRTEGVHLGRDARNARPALERLAERLLAPGRARNEAPGAGLATNSLAAWRAYEEGRRALDRWELPAARIALERAAALDPAFAPAQAWSAQAAAWAGAPAGEWSTAARLALGRPGALPPRERALARALAALAEGRHPDACAEYERALARDSADFAAWYGLGECNARDPVVLRDPRSRTGWRFRGSHRRAAEAYRRALAAAPGFLETYADGAYPRLAGLMMTEARSVRVGRAAGGDTTRLGAYPALDHDTLAFFPLPLGQMASPRAVAASPRRAEALLRGRAALREVLDAWVRASPRSALAHEAMARGLEAAGDLDAARQGTPCALAELAAARGLAEAPDLRLRLAVANVRVLLKAGRWTAAKAAADSLLAGWKAAGPHDAQRLAPLAALTGRAALLRRLLAAATPEDVAYTPRGQRVEPPVPVAQAAQEVVVADAMGLWADAVQAERRFGPALRTWVEPPERDAVRTALLGPARRLSFPRDGGRAAGAPLADAEWMVKAQQAFAAGNPHRARAILDTIARMRGDRRPGDLGADVALAEARLRWAMGDTAAAREELDLALEGLRAASAQVLDRLPEAAAVARAMRMRAAIAQAHGDAAAAHRWRAAVDALWADADPAVKAGSAY